VKCVKICDRKTFAYRDIKICKNFIVKRIKDGQHLITVSLNLACLVLDSLSVTKFLVMFIAYLDLWKRK